jgi:hypothetical protein
MKSYAMMVQSLSITQQVICHLEHQVSMCAGETIALIMKLEKFAMQYGIHIKCYQADNHPFNSKEFKDSLGV